MSSAQASVALAPKESTQYFHAENFTESCFINPCKRRILSPVQISNEFNNFKYFPLALLASGQPIGSEPLKDDKKKLMSLKTFSTNLLRSSRIRRTFPLFIFSAHRTQDEKLWLKEEDINNFGETEVQQRKLIEEFHRCAAEAARERNREIITSGLREFNSTL